MVTPPPRLAAPAPPPRPAGRQCPPNVKCGWPTTMRLSRVQSN